jgi:2,4-dienoyl-CoA reductase-like NADH-dependent reductase (Old Yellow Enzyme family)
MDAPFPHLFSPLTINGMTVRNRICSAAHFAGWMNQNGFPNDACVAYYEERARGGIGLVTIGATTVSEGDHPSYFQNLDSRFVDSYRTLATAVHRHGAKIIAQFCPRGPNVRYWELGEPMPSPPRAASLPASNPTVIDAAAHVASWRVEALQHLVACHGQAAARARAGGVDGVELHAHQHHLHAQFLSPVSNRRTDAYGGSPENRARFLVESLRAMRRAVGSDFVVGVRMKADELHADGFGEADAVAIANWLTEERLIDYLSLTVGVREAHTGAMHRPDGEYLPAAGRVRARVAVPVLFSGRITEPYMAEQALADGQVDLVAMTKAHFADAHFANKVRQGRLDDVRYCVRCQYCCDGGEDSVACIYNPVTKREREWAELRPAPVRRRVVVVGAGPAGMEAALTAAGRGHEVVVLERAARVGGQVWLAGATPTRHKMSEVARFYERQARKGLIDLRLGVAAGRDDVLALRPDAVIVATGSRPLRVDVPGVAPERLFTVEDALGGRADGARSVLVVDRDGHAPALVAADHLNGRGARVAFVAAMEQVALHMGAEGGAVYEQLRQRGVSFAAGLDLVGGRDGRLRLRDLYSGAEEERPAADAIVVAAGATPVGDLAGEIAGLVPSLHVIGAAGGARFIVEATVEGARVGRQV